MALLSRNADRIFWAARYLERAEDTARLVQEFGELFDDMPTDDASGARWAPLLVLCGDRPQPVAELTERDVVRTLVIDAENPSSVAGAVLAARSNLRTTREVLPREAWHTVNDLSLFVTDEAPRAESRRFRSRVLTRVANDSRRLEGILNSSMTRDAAWHMWRMGRYLERADMTTRVVGVRAATLMGGDRQFDEVHWMGVLKSLSALQMYQRATRGPIDATAVVRFLLFDERFPRAVRCCLDEVENSLRQLSRHGARRADVDLDDRHHDRRLRSGPGHRLGTVAARRGERCDHRAVPEYRCELMDDPATQFVDPAELQRRQTAIDRLLAAEGAGHIVHDLPVRSDGRAVGVTSRPWRLDPTPYLVAPADFAWLEAAVAQRMAMLEALLADLYGDRTLVADGTIDPAALWASSAYRLSAVGAATRRHQRRWLATYAVDVVRTVEGEWYAVADHTDTPAGLGYALLDRGVIAQVADTASGVPRAMEPALAAMRSALAATTSVDGPRSVVLTSGIDHPAYVDHSFLATQLGFNIVEGPDLVVREAQLWLQTLGGLDRVDVVHRRIAGRHLDPLEVNTSGAAGIPAVLLADEAGTVTMANAHGTGVLEEASLVGEWDRAGAALLGQTPMLALRSPRSMPVGATNVDALLPAPAERVECLLSGAVHAQPIAVRFHAVATDHGITVFPGGSGRLLADVDDPTIPTLAHVKDVWVLGAAEAAPPAADDTRTAPQVDFLTSVPTSAAHSLYWLNRAAERAEAVARATRVIATTSASVAAQGSAAPALSLVRALAGDDAPVGDAATPGQRNSAVAVASASLSFHIGSMLAESASVREFLSTTTGRVLGEMADTRVRLAAHPDDVDALDTLLFQLSAVSGLWSESVVRGPAWYYGDFAKRYERALVALTSARSAIELSVGDEVSPPVRRRALESVLASNDSLVAYRRRQRSEVELSAVLALLLHDERNPRSAAASVAGMLRNAAAIGWGVGERRLADVAGAVAAIGPTDVSAVLAVDAELHEIARELTSTRLVAPPHPTLVGSRLVDPGAVA